jgi:amino acid adenylation domain-containing protein
MKAIHTLFRTVAARYPGNTALVYSNEIVTYAELDAYSDSVASDIAKCTIRREAPVCVLLERSISLVASFFGILKAGAVYVPIDPTMPDARISQIINEVEPAAIITTSNLVGRLNSKCPILLADSLKYVGSEQTKTLNANKQDSGVDPGLAYIIFTSGSTGVPKGVMVEHHTVINFLSWRHSLFRTKPSDVFLQKGPLGFDLSISEMLLPLTAGASLVIAPHSRHVDIDQLLRLVHGHKVTRLSLLPSMLKILLTHWTQKCSSVTDLVCGGEVLPSTLAVKFYAMTGGKCRLYNMYGPTEATIICSSYKVPEAFDGGAVPIGHPITGVQFYALSKRKRVVKPGRIGELFIAGNCLARGYLNQPRLTRQRFLNIRLTPDHLTRMYKTGDLVRELKDGTYEFLGRSDDQVKVLGVRIELNEIALALESHNQVEEALVVVRNEEDRAAIVAYYVSDVAIPSKALLEFLRNRIPQYMLPAAFVHLKGFPTNTNGKIDKALLPPPTDIPTNFSGTEMQKKIREIWCAKLKKRNIKVDDNFFDLGGDSLLSTQITAELSDVFGFELKATTIHLFPTIYLVSTLIEVLTASKSLNTSTT